MKPSESELLLFIQSFIFSVVDFNEKLNAKRKFHFRLNKIINKNFHIEAKCHTKIFHIPLDGSMNSIKIFHKNHKHNGKWDNFISVSFSFICFVHCSFFYSFRSIGFVKKENFTFASLNEQTCEWCETFSAPCVCVSVVTVNLISLC